MHLRVNWRGGWATQPGHREELQTPAAATERVGPLGTIAGSTGRTGITTASPDWPRHRPAGNKWVPRHSGSVRQRPDHIRGPGSGGTYLVSTSETIGESRRLG